MQSDFLKKRLDSVNKHQDEVVKTLERNATPLNRDESEIVNKLTNKVAETYRDQIAREGFSEAVKVSIKNTISDYCKNLEVPYEVQKKIEHNAIVNIIGLGPLESYMQDKTITEIIVQRYDNILVERNGLTESVNVSFKDEEHLLTIINRIVQPIGRSINVARPMVDGRLPDGSRINATIKPASPDGATLTIRKFSDDALTGDDYLNLKSLSKNMLAFLKKSVEAKISIIVSGGTDTGKTTLLNMLSAFIPENELIITIEDSCELRLKQKNVRRLEARVSENKEVMPITIQSLVKNALRMRPDRIIVGEIRDGTVVDMLSAMSTGHEGSMTTVHANNPSNLMNARMKILYSMNDSASFSEESQNLQIADALQLVVHITKMPDGSRKITQITHINGLDEKGRINLTDIFKYDAEKQNFVATGYIPEQIIQKAKKLGIEIPKLLFDKDGED